MDEYMVILTYKNNEEYKDTVFYLSQYEYSLYGSYIEIKRKDKCENHIIPYSALKEIIIN